MLIASATKHRLVKVTVTYLEVHSEYIFDQFGENSGNVETWNTQEESIFYIMAPSTYTNGELIEYITEYLRQEVETSDMIKVEPNSFALSVIEFIDSINGVQTVLFTECDIGLPKRIASA